MEQTLFIDYGYILHITWVNLFIFGQVGEWTILQKRGMNKIGQEVRKESRFCKEPCNVIVIAKDPLFKNDVKKIYHSVLNFSCIWCMPTSDLCLQDQHTSVSTLRSYRQSSRMRFSKLLVAIVLKTKYQNMWG